MATLPWDAEQNIDFLTGENVPVEFPEFDVLIDQIRVTDPALHAHQFDGFDVNQNDFALILARDSSGAALPPAAIRYVIATNTSGRIIGITPAGPPGGNLMFDNKDDFTIGDGTSGILDDDGPNVYEPGPDVFANVFYGLGGNDTARAAPGGGRLFGNTGQDSLLGGPGGDSIFGGKDDDVIRDTSPPGGVSVFNLFAGDLGNDTLVASPSGNNTLLGGPGNDEIFYFFTPENVSAIQRIFAGADADTVIADGLSGEATISGDKGADDVQVNGFQGALFIDLGPGPDRLRYTNGLDGETTVLGGDGADVMEFDAPLGKATLDGGGDGDLIIIGAGPLAGGAPAFALTVNGADGADTIDVTGGIRGGTFDGGDGDDLIFVRPDLVADNGLQYGFLLLGGTGDDTLEAGPGSTQLFGGPGQDHMVGGADRDRFFYPGAPVNGEEDTISSFTPQFDGVALGAWAPDLQIYCDIDGTGAGPGHNFLIAIGQSYDLDGFQAFLAEGAADTAKPGFYLFHTAGLGGTLWFDTDMSGTAGAVLVTVFDQISAPNQLGAFAIGTFYAE